MKHRPDQHIAHMVPEAASPEVSPMTLGASAVFAEDRRVTHDVNLGQLEQNIAIRDNLLDEKDDPNRMHPVAAAVGSLVGKTLSPSERNFVTVVDRYESDADAVRKAREESTDRVGFELLDIRGKLLSLGEGQRTVLDRHLDRSAAPFLRYVKGWKATSDASWSQWLGKEADDEQLMNFLQWHVGSIERAQQSPDFKEFAERSKTLFQQRALKGVEQGWLAYPALEASRTVEKMSLYVGDIFDTTLNGTHGHHFKGSDYVMLRHGVERERSGLDVAFHEIGHATIGRRELSDHADISAVWIDEALTHHTTQSLLYGSPEILDPSKRKEHMWGYNEQRSLVATLLSGGRYEIPALMATRAYSGGDKERAEFRDALRKSYGVDDVLWLTNIFVNEATKNNLMRGMSPTDAQRHACDSVAAWIRRRGVGLYEQAAGLAA